jgi:hypothetical protein
MSHHTVIDQPKSSSGSVKARFLTLGLAACALAVGPSAAAAAPAGDAGVPKPSAGPVLKKAQLHKGVLTVRARCQRDGSVSLRSNGRRLRTATLSCRSGRAAGRLRLPGATLRRARTASGLKLTVTVKDSRGSTSVDLDTARPSKGGDSGVPSAGLSANMVWIGPSSFCTYFGTQRHHEVYANNARFGYPLHTRLWIRAVLGVYNPATGVHSWTIGGWAQHEAGISNIYTSQGLIESLKQGFSVNVRRVYSRSYIEVYRGDWNYVNVAVAPQFVSPYWCYWA